MPDTQSTSDSVVHFPLELMDEIERGDVPAATLQPLIDDLVANAAGAAEVELGPAETELALTSSVAEHRHKLGRHKLPNQSRMHKHGPLDWRYETRTAQWDVFVTFRHPTMNTFVNHAITCAGVAAGVGVIVAVATESPSVGLALFKPAWKACMVTKVGLSIANEIQVELSKEKKHGPWSGH